MLRTELFDCFTMETTSVLNIQSIDVGRPTMFEGNFHYNEELIRGVLTGQTFGDSFKVKNTSSM